MMQPLRFVAGKVVHDSWGGGRLCIPTDLFRENYVGVFMQPPDHPSTGALLTLAFTSSTPFFPCPRSQKPWHYVYAIQRIF
jgi:hypothetical protein